jgi:hypothetical protein
MVGSLVDQQGSVEETNVLGWTGHWIGHTNVWELDKLLNQQELNLISKLSI